MLITLRFSIVFGQGEDWSCYQFLLRELNEESMLWDVLVDPAEKSELVISYTLAGMTNFAEVIDNTTSRGRTLRFLFEGSKADFIKDF